MEGVGRFPDELETVLGPSSLHVLRRTSVRYRLATQRAYSGGNDQGVCGRKSG